jgi:hypothetical protein
MDDPFDPNYPSVIPIHSLLKATRYEPKHTFSLWGVIRTEQPSVIPIVHVCFDNVFRIAIFMRVSLLILALGGFPLAFVRSTSLC